MTANAGTVRHIGVDGASLAVRSWPGEGPALIAIHGLSSNSAFFVGVAEAMAGRRPIHAIDLVGRGQSDKPESGYGMVRHARDVAAVIEALETGPAVVVGHSMGAIVALAVAQTQPEACAGAVLYDGGAHAVRAMADDPEALGQFLESGKGIEGRLDLSFDSAAAYADYWAELGIFDRVDTPWVSAYLAADVAPAADGRLSPRCSRVAVNEDIGDALSRAASLLESVPLPVMVIAADNGLVDGDRPLVPDAGLAAMAEDLPTFDAHRIAGCNHYTIALADPGATQTAELVLTHAKVCGR